MKTKISLLTGLITALLFAMALSSAALPEQDYYGKVADDVKKATASKASPTPTPRNPLPSSFSSSAPTQTTKNAGDAFSDRQPPAPAPKPSKNIEDFVSGQTVPNGVQVPKPAPSAEADESASNDTGDQHGKPKTG